jgi:hypothetical protein
LCVRQPILILFTSIAAFLQDKNQFSEQPILLLYHLAKLG